MSAKKSSKKRSGAIWKAAGLQQLVQNQIEAGVLLKEDGLESLLGAINHWAEQSEDYRGGVTAGALRSHLDKLVWTPKRIGLLKQVLRLNRPLDTIYKRLGFLPKVMIDRQAQRLRGHTAEFAETAVKSAAGYHRLMTAGDIAATKIINLIPPTARNPLEIAVSNPRHFRMPVINGPHIGAPYNPVFAENIVRNTFFHAQRVAADGVLITGGLMLLDTKRSHGGLTVHRGRISGFNYNRRVMDSVYVDRADKVRALLPADDVAFYTLREIFLNLILGWRKIATHSNGLPIFSGKVHIVLGRQEEELIEEAGMAEIRYIVAVKRNEIMREKQELMAHRDFLLSEGATKADLKGLDAQIDDLIRIHKRMILSNVAPEDKQRFFDVVRSFLIESYRKAIPNCEVIAMGTCFISVGGKRIEIHQDREETPNETFLDDYLRRNGGRRGLEGTLPDLVLLAGAFNVNGRAATIECMKDLERRTTEVWQLPVSVDNRVLKLAMNQVIRRGTPFERLLRNEHFEPGVFEIRYTDGLWTSGVLGVEMLAKYQERRPRLRRASAGGYIWIYLDSDTHFGDSWREIIEDPRTGRLLGLETAAIEMFRREFLEKGRPVPFHGYVSLGDRTQMHNFKTEAQPHPHVQLYPELEAQFLEQCCQASKKDPQKAAQLMKDLCHEALLQIWRRGNHWPQDQMREVLEGFIKPNTDFFYAILQRATKAGVRFAGVGEVLYGRDDRRDIGVVTEVTGNHGAKTLDDQLTEAFIYMDRLRERLFSCPANRHGRFSEADLRRMVRAPVYGNLGIGWGHVWAGDGYRWGVSYRHDPSAKSGQNGDPLQGALRNVLERGDFARIFSERHTLHFSGDIHRSGFVCGPRVVVVSCAACKDTDPYGERGFAQSNLSTKAVGVPVYGPEQGPVLQVEFNHDWVRRWFAKPFEVDWDQVLVNAI